MNLNPSNLGANFSSPSSSEPFFFLCFSFESWRERLVSGKENDREVLVDAAEMAVAEATAEMEAARIPDFFISHALSSFSSTLF